MGRKSIGGKMLASVCCLLVFGGAAIGTTVALFTSKKEVNAHLKIGGPLKASLYLTDLTQDVLGEDGMIAERKDDLTAYRTSKGEDAYDKDHKGVDLSVYDKNLAFFDGIVPTMTGKMEFLLVNTGDIAFSYSIDHTLSCFGRDGDLVDDEKILDQISYKVDSSKTLLKAGEEDKITLTYKFLDKEENNSAMEMSFSLDFSVNVVQVTK